MSEIVHAKRAITVQYDVRENLPRWHLLEKLGVMKREIKCHVPNLGDGPIPGKHASLNVLAVNLQAFEGLQLRYR